jgi:predicted MPP superfamily phosphohydrolase
MKLSKISRRRFLRAVLWGAPALALADAFLLEPAWLKIRRVRLAREKPEHRFVHFTDLHHKGDHQYLRSVVQKINALSPEFVCFTGDIVEDTEHLAEALEILQGVNSPLFGVPGNHDYWCGAEFAVIDKAFRATGGRWLLDEPVTLARRNLTIIGDSCRHAPKAVPNPKTKNILLIHYPEWADKLGTGKFDVILAGHSHGGQVRIPFFGPLMVPFGVGQYDLGLFQTAAGPLYVNAGIGYFHIDVRFNCRPELTVFEL